MTSAMGRDKWFREARRAAKFFWMYEGLVDDAEAECEAAFLAGKDPYETIEAIGKELELFEFGPAFER